MIYKVEQEFIEAYFKSLDVNNSLLNDLEFNPKKAEKKIKNPKIEDDDKKHLIIGSATDCLLTQPEEEFNNQFIVVQGKRPTGLTNIFINNLPLDITPDSPVDHYQKAYNEAGYRWPIKSAIDILWKSSDYKAWYMARKSAAGRTLISKEEYDAVMYASKCLFSNPFTREFFLSAGTDENIDIIYQAPIYFNITVTVGDKEYTRRCKALPDIIVKDKLRKKIFLYDLKTIGKSLTQFESSFVNFGYFRQAAFYKKGMENFLHYTNWKKDSFNRINPQDSYIISPTHPLNELFKDCIGWEVSNLEFIVAETDTKFQHEARIFTTTDNDYYVGMNGGESEKYSSKVSGIYTLMEHLIWHEETDYWSMPKDIYLNRGRQVLDSFKHDQIKPIHTSDSGFNLQ